MMSLKAPSKKVDEHTENRLEAAYTAFEERRLPRDQRHEVVKSLCKRHSERNAVASGLSQETHKGKAMKRCKAELEAAEFASGMTLNYQELGNQPHVEQHKDR